MLFFGKSIQKNSHRRNGIEQIVVEGRLQEKTIDGHIDRTA